VTTRNAIITYNFPRRVPAAKIFSAISGNFRIVYTEGAEKSSYEVTPAHSGIEGLGRVAVLPGPMMGGFRVK